MEEKAKQGWDTVRRELISEYSVSTHRRAGGNVDSQQCKLRVNETSYKY